MEHDKDLLARAVAAVVLQRDVSLSRRVYSWFLGKEGTEAYFARHGLDLLHEVLLRDMEADERSAYQIFLSMLDKVEIGSLLASRLIMPALRSLKGHDDGIASAVYEAVEPEPIWQNIWELVDKKVSRFEFATDSRTLPYPSGSLLYRFTMKRSFSSSHRSYWVTC